MGIEIIYPIGAGLGILVLIWLVIRSFLPSSRPFALPTLLAALLVAFFERDRVSPDFYWMALLDVFFSARLRSGSTLTRSNGWWGGEPLGRRLTIAGAVRDLGGPSTSPLGAL